MPEIVKTHRERISPWVSILEKDVRFDASKSPAKYHFLTQNDYVGIIARTENGLFPIVRQFRPCVEDFTWEFPAGTVDAGESPSEAAVRELVEETGFESIEIHTLGDYFPDTGRLALRSFGFFAKIKNEPTKAVTEEGIDVKLVSASELKSMILNGIFKHQLHLALISSAMLRGLKVF